MITYHNTGLNISYNCDGFKEKFMELHKDKFKITKFEIKEIRGIYLYLM